MVVAGTPGFVIAKFRKDPWKVLGWLTPTVRGAMYFMMVVFLCDEAVETRSRFVESYLTISRDVLVFVVIVESNNRTRRALSYVRSTSTYQSGDNGRSVFSSPVRVTARLYLHDSPSNFIQ